MPRRVAQKWDENIKHYEELRQSANLSSTQDRSLLYSDISMRKTYENSLRKTVGNSDMKTYLNVYKDPLRRSMNSTTRNFMTATKQSGK